MELSREELERIIDESVQRAVAKAHVCSLGPVTLEVLNDRGAQEVLRTLGKNMTPNSASTLARVGRMLDKFSFDLGVFILRVIVLGAIGVTVWLFFKKNGG